jgi:hypothetical protein
MRAERVILSFVAILIGLLVAGGAFFVYQLTRQLPPEETKAITVKTPPTPTPSSSQLLVLTSPSDETVSNKKTITITGKTVAGSTVVVSSETDDQVVEPTKNGDFTVTHTIGDDTTIITVLAIFPNGEEQSVTRSVSYSAEEF